MTDVALIRSFCLPSYLPRESLGGGFAFFVAFIGLGCYHTFIPMAVGDKLKVLCRLRALPADLATLYYNYTQIAACKKKIFSCVIAFNLVQHKHIHT